MTQSNRANSIPVTSFGIVIRAGALGARIPGNTAFNKGQGRVSAQLGFLIDTVTVSAYSNVDATPQSPATLNASRC